MSLLTPGGVQCNGFTVGLCSWPLTSATSGNDTAATNGTAYYVSVYVPGVTEITGVQFLLGSVGGTDKVIASLYDVSGELLANSSTAGVTAGTTATTQQIPFTVPYVADAPNLYLVALTFNGTTAKFRSIPAYCDNGAIAGSSAQTFGTPAALVISGTKFTANLGPVLSLY